MLRFLLGLLVGAALLAGGFVAWSTRAPCLARCGDGTRCDGARCVPAVAATTPTAAAPTTRRKRTRGGPSKSAPSGGAGEPLAPAAPEVTLQPGDEKPVAQGDALGRPEHVDLSQRGDDGRALEQDDLDAVMKPAEGRITGCITTALGDAPLDTARVEVAFRVERDGAVHRMRVTAPQLLQRNGVTRCIRAVVTALRFPASGGASVATYPYEVR